MATVRRGPISLAAPAAALIAALVPAAAGAQASDSDFQAWSAVIVSGPAAEQSRFLLWFDGHMRFRDDASDLGVSILRPGIGWRATDDLDLWLGYARVVSRGDGAPDVEEDRLWQQATYPIATVLGGHVSGRTRLEQRFRETGDDTGWRLRQFVRWERRFEGRAVSPVVWNELFVNLNDTNWGQADGFDQNRFFVGAAWRISHKARFEAGYLNNRLNTPLAEDRTNHNASLTLFVGL